MDKLASMDGFVGRGNNMNKGVKKAFWGTSIHISMNNSVGCKEE